MEKKRSFKCLLVAIASISQLAGVAKADIRKTEDVTPSAGALNSGCPEYAELFNEYAYRLKSAIDGGLYRASLSEEEEKSLLSSFAQNMPNFRCISNEIWEKQSNTKKKLTVAHEVCKLVGLDSDNNADTSRSLMGLWKN